MVHSGTHTNTNTHYTASSIQAPFGCPANPALVVHALERLRLCCLILPVRGIWDNEHNAHQKHFTSLCPGLRKKCPLPKIPPRRYKTIKFKRPPSKLQIKRRYELHPLGTQTTSQRTQHTLYFYPSSDAPRSSALRWNVCASAVCFCPCGAFGTHATHTTHTTKIFHFVVPWAAEKKIPSQKYRLVLTKS